VLSPGVRLDGLLADAARASLPRTRCASPRQGRTRNNMLHPPPLKGSVGMSKVVPIAHSM
jgi:hypothetical protein